MSQVTQKQSRTMNGTIMQALRDAGVRFRHYHDRVTGKLVATICTMEAYSDPSLTTPDLVRVAFAFCSPKDVPNRHVGRAHALFRLQFGDYVEIPKDAAFKQSLLNGRILDKCEWMPKWFMDVAVRHGP